MTLMGLLRPISCDQIFSPLEVLHKVIQSLELCLGGPQPILKGPMATLLIIGGAL
jgi:hypothetical protein